MMKISDIIQKISGSEMHTVLAELYGSDTAVLSAQKERYIEAVRAFASTFPDREEAHLFSAPGRCELGGNHTDHQHGCALAAAVSLDAIAVVSYRQDGVIRVMSDGYGLSEIVLSDLSVREEEKGHSAALIRGIAAKMTAAGMQIGGFDAYVVSDVVSGSGLSSSAAFETLIATIINARCGDSRLRELAIAEAGQYAENRYFGKNCGLLDQTVCSFGGLLFIDFADGDAPTVERLHFDFETAGYRLCVTDTKGSHSDLTEDYAAVVNEMNAVAERFGCSCLREVEEEAFFDVLPQLREKVGDRAVLRAMHFFGENRRAAEEKEALQNGDMERFLALFRQSAASSADLLQNLYSVKNPAVQGIPLALAVSRRVLGDNSAVRVHGGGFAGTIQALVPSAKAEEYIARMDALFGAGSCTVLRLRPVGGIRII